MDVLLQAEVIRTQSLLSRSSQRSQRVLSLIGRFDRLSVQELDELLDLLLQTQRDYEDVDLHEEIQQIRLLRAEKSGLRTD